MELRSIWIILLWIKIILVATREVTQICPVYHAKRTNSGKNHYCFCVFQACPGEYISIDGCLSKKGSQIFYLINEKGMVINSSLQYSTMDTCNNAAQIENSKPIVQSSNCELYKVKEGCKGMGACKGAVRIRISSSPLPPLNESNNQLQEHNYIRQHSHFEQLKKNSDIGGDSTFGYCSTSKEFSIFELFLISFAGFFVIFLCGFSFLPLFVALLQCLFCSRSRANRLSTSRQRLVHTPSVTELSDDNDSACR